MLKRPDPPEDIDVSAIRRPMTLARKRRIHGRHDGKCGLCGKAVPLTGPNVRYDHEPPIWITLRDIDEDVRPLCLDCDKPKTANDQGVIGKVKRLISKAAGTWRPNRKRIPAGRKLQSNSRWPKGKRPIPRRKP